MKYEELITFVYKLFGEGIKLWEEEKIKIFVPENKILSIQQKDLISANRDEIIKTLRENSLFSDQYNWPILKIKLSTTNLSYGQERLWFIEEYEGGTKAYNISLVFRIVNASDINMIKQSIVGIVTRHEVLRTLIRKDEEGNGYQQVMSAAEYALYPVKEIQVSSTDQLEIAIEGELNHIYDLSKEYPIRVRLYNNTSDSTCYLSIVIHHIAFDGWSTDIFLEELRKHYYYYKKEQSTTLADEKISIDLPVLTIQYKDFALWQKHYLSGARLAKQLEYWKNKLQGYESTNLVTDYPRPKDISYAGADISFELEASLSNELRKLAKELRVSLYSVLLAGYYLTIRAYTNQDDLIVGTPAANRHYPQVEHLIGFFINSLALRIKVDSEMLLKDFIQAVGHEVISAQTHQDLPFEKLVEELRTEKDTSRHPVFQMMFGVQSFGNETEDSSNKLSEILELYEPSRSLHNVAQFDISVFIDDSKEILTGNFNYATSLYSEATIKGYIETYQVVLKQLGELAQDKVKQHSCRVAQVNYLNSNSYRQVVEVWNDTDKEYPQDKTIAQLFEEQVHKTPNNTAVVYEDIKLSYSELNAQANRLAHYLVQHYSITGDNLVALCLDRSEQMLVAILAVLKAGGAYVPIEPSYPNERIKYIIEDTAAKVILTNTVYVDRLSKNVLKHDGAVINSIIVAIDKQSIQEALQSYPEYNLLSATTSSNLAYVIYTSGTTGKPKGVMIEHKAFICTVDSIKNHHFGTYLNISTYSITNYVFDIFGLEYGLTLLTGGKIFLGDSELINLNSNKYDFIQLTPTLCEAKLLQLKNSNKLLIGGESLDLGLLNRVLHRGFEVVNMYGPTETTIWSTTKVYTSFKNHESSISKVTLGSMLSNERGYVLNKELQLVPIGGVGELYIGGAGLARGYLNKPDLTRERFIANPFQTTAEKEDKRYNSKGCNARLYKTGDLVRLLADGSLEFIGRNDFQVKIRGYRIELGEIESCLVSYPSVRQAVVTARDHVNTDGSVASKYLVGYYVSEQKLNEASIISYLHSELPEYMVPILVHLEKLPLTVNGKLDRNALPAPEFVSKDQYVAPRSELEKKLCSIWASVLGLAEDKLSINDDFFGLGGDSISAIKLISRSNTSLHSTLTVAQLFKYSTIESIATCMGNFDSKTLIPRYLCVNPQEQLLSFYQKELWEMEKTNSGTNSYNIPMIFRLNSAINLDILSYSVRAVVERHEILRTLIRQEVDGQVYQLVVDDYLPNINNILVFDSRMEFDKSIEKTLIEGFDLSNEIPIKVKLYTLQTQSSVVPSQIEHYMSIIVHHIAFDIWSIDIFLNDLNSYYNYYLNNENEALNLPILSIQYKDFAKWHTDFIDSNYMNQQKKYWRDKLHNYSNLSIPTDKVRQAAMSYVGIIAESELNMDTTQNLRTLAKALRVSLHNLLLGGYYLLLRKYSKQDNIVVGVYATTRHYPQVENLIGYFVNDLAIRLTIDTSQTLTNFIKLVNQVVIEAQLNKDVPFELIINDLSIKREMNRHPIFQTVFAMQSNSKPDIIYQNNQYDVVDTNYEPSVQLPNLSKWLLDSEVFIEDSDPCIKISFNYAECLYNRITVIEHLNTYANILEKFSLIYKNNGHSINTLDSILI